MKFGLGCKTLCSKISDFCSAAFRFCRYRVIAERDSSLDTDSIRNAIRGHRSFGNNVLKVALPLLALGG